MQLGKATREAYGEALAALGADMPELISARRGSCQGDHE